MAIKQTSFGKGNARREMPTPQAAGQPVEVIGSHTFTEAVTTADILELCPLPPYAKITHFDFVSESLPVGNATIGVMSGDFGSIDPARTSGSELVNAASSVSGTVALLNLVNLAVNGEANKSLGFKHSVNITANVASKLHWRMRYVVGTS
jgi:hypothetical protein